MHIMWTSSHPTVFEERKLLRKVIYLFENGKKAMTYFFKGYAFAMVLRPTQNSTYLFAVLFT